MAQLTQEKAVLPLETTQKALDGYSCISNHQVWSLRYTMLHERPCPKSMGHIAAEQVVRMACAHETSLSTWVTLRSQATLQRMYRLIPVCPKTVQVRVSGFKTYLCVDRNICSEV